MEKEIDTSFDVKRNKTKGKITTNINSYDIKDWKIKIA